jgi:ABC-type polar amino acid transport system ATPase subunit
MIRVRSLVKRFGSRVVLDGIDADVQDGECIAVVGSSGCGKSTMLRCLNALEPFDEGTIDIDDIHLISSGLRHRNAPKAARELRQVVGMVFQEFHLFPHLTVLQNIALAPRVVVKRARTDAETHARDLLARVGLADRAGSYPGQLSGGQKQRVAIARALAMPLRALLLDEPTSALDPAMREEVREVIRTLARESSLTLVLATHEMRLASELADRVWVMEAGRIAAQGTPAEVLRGRLTNEP